MNMVVKIRRRSQCEWAIVYAIFFPFLFGLLIDGLGLPSAVKYTIDIMWLFLLLVLGLNHFRMPHTEGGRLLRVAVTFFAVSLVGAFAAFQSPLYYLWGFRNNFRFFVFFFACVAYLRREHAQRYLEALDWLFYLNFFVAIFQYFVMGYSQDRLGGIFGVHVGSNATTVVFFSIVMAKSVLCLMNNRESIWKCGLKCVMALVISVFAELKVFFLMMLAIVVFSALITRFSFKKLAIFFFALIAVFIGAKLMERVFSNWENWFSLERIWLTLVSENGYTGAGDINRLTGIPIAWKRFLTTWPKRLLGLGLGNCDTSSFAFLNTPFYKRSNYLHYNWFSLPFLFLETGILGLACYLAFFIRLYFQAVRAGARRIDSQLARVMVMVCIIMIVYNQSLRTEAGYMVYFVLALPFMGSAEKPDRKEGDEKNEP